MNGFGGFGAPAAPPAGGGGGGDGKPVMTSMVLPADPTWEPLDLPDVLTQNGFFAGKIIAEKPVDDGVWLTLELQDSDVGGKRLQTKLEDLSQKPKMVFKWRGLLLSITGNKEAARAQFGYQPGVFTGQTCYFKTQSYPDKNGDMRTGIDNWITKVDYDAAVAAGKHRWTAELSVKPATAAASFGAAGTFGAPGAMPPSFPVPQPPAAAPIQVAPAAAVQPPAAPPAAVPGGFPVAATPPAGPPAGFVAQAPAAAPGTVVPPPAASPFAFPGMGGK